jgi:hypothetical protein
MFYTGEDLESSRMKPLSYLLVSALLASPLAARAAESCITQSQMQPAERAAVAAVATGFAQKIQANDANGVRSATIAEFRTDFSAMADEIASTAPHLASAQPQVDQVYILDASTLAKAASGANPDAQFFCTLNKSTNEAEFTIPQLPPGKYLFAMVRMESANPWLLSMLLRQDAGQWLLAGLYPKHLTADGHDGLWYWKQARTLNGGASKEPWNAWLYYQEAQALLMPASFVSSTHLDKLQTELTSALPSAVSGGISTDAPLVVKGGDGSEFRFTALTVEDAPGTTDKVDIAAHIKVDSLGDGAAARKRNIDAMTALLAAHPELRKGFHGVWVFSDAPDQSPYGTELAMSEIK